MIVGAVRVLLVSVSVPAKVDTVPDVGSVILVEPLVVSVRAFAPLSVSDAPLVPRLVIVFALLSKPFLATNLLVVAIFDSLSS